MVLARQIGETSFADLAAAFPDLPQSIQYRGFMYPHGFIDIIVGKFLFYSGVHVMALAISLDLIVGAISYLNLAHFFRLLDKRPTDDNEIFMSESRL